VQSKKALEKKKCDTNTSSTQLREYRVVII